MKMEAEIRGMCPHAEENMLASSFNYQELGSDTDPFLDLSEAVISLAHSPPVCTSF